MTDAYDTLMDHLATLAVEAVERPACAVQAYWLLCAAQPHAPYAQNLPDGVSPVPEWAAPYVLEALQRVRQSVHWCEPGQALPLSQPPVLATLTASARVSWRWQPTALRYLDEIQEHAQRIWQVACRVYGPQPACLAALPPEVWRGGALFDAGLYFACHEYFESFWGRTADAASDFYQGLIQIAVAMRHLESHNVRGAVILLRYGMGRLQRYPAIYKALPLASFVQQLGTLLAQLVTLTEPTGYQFDPRQVPRLLPLTEGDR